MRDRLIDLETVSHADANLWLEPVECDPKLLEPIEPDSRLKDPVKVAANLAEVERRRAARPSEIEASIAERTQERNERLSLDPDCCRIVALGFHDVGHDAPRVWPCRNEDEEKMSLQLFWDGYMKRATRLIGFNSARFDLPVLIMRSLYLNVSHPEIVVAPAWKTIHVDLWEKLSLGGVRRDVKGLRFYAKRFGIPIYDDISGKDVAAAVQAGEWEKVVNHCLYDLDLTRALAEKLNVLKPEPIDAKQMVF